MSTKRMAGKSGRPVKLPGEKSTREKIMEVAIAQFSERGYDSVSMRDIADAVGIRESAIYRHYVGKERIMDAIIESLIEDFQPAPGQAPTETLPEQCDPAAFVERAARAVMERLKEPHVRMICRLLCIELYRNAKIRDFFRHTFMEPSYQSWEQMVREMIDRGYVDDCDAREIAVELTNYSIFLYFDCFVIRYDESSYEALVDEMISDFSRHARFVFKTAGMNGGRKGRQNKKTGA